MDRWPSNGSPVDGTSFSIVTKPNGLPIEAQLDDVAQRLGAKMTR